MKILVVVGESIWFMVLFLLAIFLFQEYSRWETLGLGVICLAGAVITLLEIKDKIKD